ncbi:MAG TPA: UdgX family uracil-DNA binding protein [Actinomycetota bacterium]|nr:UdgX family uracil-DNA binding protein [Actinomycetota bacterium]
MTDDHPTATPFLPARATLPALRRAAETCTGCELHHLGTRTVFGEGPRDTRLMLAGEQPGDHEDREGRPFVGPAGRLLDAALERAGIPRDEVYLTNVVKHFRWEARGKRRIHRKPTLAHVAACRPWFEAEIATIRPDLLVLLGSTAAQALLGSSFRVTQRRGTIMEVQGLEPKLLATVHPSSILRARDEDRDREEGAFVRDLVIAADAIASAATARASSRRTA